MCHGILLCVNQCEILLSVGKGVKVIIKQVYVLAMTTLDAFQTVYYFYYHKRFDCFVVHYPQPSKPASLPGQPITQWPICVETNQTNILMYKPVH